MPRYTKIPIDEEADICDNLSAIASRQQMKKFDLGDWGFINSRFLILQLVLLGLYSIIFIGFSKRYAVGYHGANLFYSPAREAIRYEITHFNATLWIDSPYVQPPSPETDKMWHDLVDNFNIILPASEMKKANVTSIPVPNQPGMYFSGLGVFHELHCLKRLRQFMYPEYYFPNLQEDDVRLNRMHNDHCIEVLRQAVMCHGDISLVTIRWQESQRQPVADFSAPHECVNFDSLNEWARERRIDAMQPGLLVHPILGPSYPKGENPTVGASENTEKFLPSPVEGG